MNNFTQKNKTKQKQKMIQIKNLFSTPKLSFCM